VRDQVSHPYSRTGKITVLYILIFRFFDIRGCYNIHSKMHKAICLLYTSLITIRRKPWQ